VSCCRTLDLGRFDEGVTDTGHLSAQLQALETAIAGTRREALAAPGRTGGTLATKDVAF
jgi:hypothetical protein